MNDVSEQRTDPPEFLAFKARMRAIYPMLRAATPMPQLPKGTKITVWVTEPMTP